MRCSRPFNDRVVIVETVAGGTPDGRSDIALFDTFAGRRHALERVREMLADGDIAKVVLYTWDAPTAFLNDITLLRIDGVIMKSETGERLVDAGSVSTGANRWDSIRLVTRFRRWC